MADPGDPERAPRPARGGLRPPPGRDADADVRPIDPMVERSSRRNVPGRGEAPDAPPARGRGGAPGARSAATPTTTDTPPEPRVTTSPARPGRRTTGAGTPADGGTGAEDGARRRRREAPAPGLAPRPSSTSTPPAAPPVVGARGAAAAAAAPAPAPAPEEAPSTPAAPESAGQGRTNGKGRRGRKGAGAAPWLTPLDGAASLGPAAARTPADPFAARTDGDEDVRDALASLGAIPGATTPRAESREAPGAPTEAGTPDPVVAKAADAAEAAAPATVEPPAARAEVAQERPTLTPPDAAAAGAAGLAPAAAATPEPVAATLEPAPSAAPVAEEPAPTGSWFEPPDDGGPAVEPLPTAATPLLEVLGPAGTGGQLLVDPDAPMTTGMVPLVGAGTGAALGPVPAEAMSRRARRRAARPRVRRVVRIVRRVDAWSVFKVSVIFFVTMYLILMVAGVLLWSLAISTGTIDNAEQFITELFALDSFSFDGAQIFKASLFGGGVLVVAGTGAAVTLAVLFNLISDMMGGIRITVLEQEPPRRRAPAPGTAPR